MTIEIRQREGEVHILNCDMIFTVRRHVLVMRTDLCHHLYLGRVCFLPGVTLVPMLAIHHRYMRLKPDLGLIGEILQK